MCVCVCVYIEAEDGSKKPKLIAKSCIFTNYLIKKSCRVIYYYIIQLTEKHTKGMACFKIVNSCFVLYLRFPTAS